jgi:hypothetical protein
MALFGDDVENYAQQPQQQSFFGSVGSFLLSAIKFVAIAALAITGIGALLSNSDTARDTVDKFTGGKGKGLGTTIANIYDKTKRAIFSPSTPTSDDVAETVEVNGTKALRPIPKTLPLDKPQEYEVLRDINKAIKNSGSAILTKTEIDKNLLELTKKQDDLLTQGLKYEAWNRKVDNYSNEFADALASGRVPVPPKINLDKIPDLPDSLAEYGKKTFEDWDKLTKLEQIKHLRDDILRSPKKEPEIKYTLGNNSYTDNVMYEAHKASKESSLGKGVINSWGKGVLNRFGLDNTPTIPDVGIEVIRLDNIKEAIDKDDYNDAIKMSKEASAYFLKRGKELDNGQAMNVETKKKGERYKNTSDNFNEWSDYATHLKRVEELKKTLSEANGVIIDASRQIPTVLAPHERQIEVMLKDERTRKQQPEQGINVNAPAAEPKPAKSVNNGTAIGVNDNLASISGKDADTFKLLMAKVDDIKISPNSTLPPPTLKKKDGHEASVTV